MDYGTASTVVGILGVAAQILLIAWFNYTSKN